MTRFAYIVRYLSAFACSLTRVYLVWIGAQYVFYHNVILDFVDGFMAIAVAMFITRDLINVINKLSLINQFSKQHA